MKRNAKWWLGILLVASLVTDIVSVNCWGEIQCKEVYEANEPIVVVVQATEVPVEAKLRGSVQITDASHLCPDPQKSTYYVWAGPGKHTVTASGVWVLTTDVDLNGTKVPVLVDFGQYSYTKTFVVEGGGDVVPPPPPPPPGQRSAVILEESEERTTAQAALWQQIQSEFQPQRLLILDDDQPSAAKYRPQAGSVRPALLVFQAGQFLRAVPVPSSVAAIKAEVGR